MAAGSGRLLPCVNRKPGMAGTLLHRRTGPCYGAGMFVVMITRTIKTKTPFGGASSGMRATVPTA